MHSQGGPDQIPLSEPITPSQYYDSRRSVRSDSPIARLMLAVLADAVATFQKHAGAKGTSSRRLFREVEAWFFGKGGDDPFSFESLCDALDIDHHAFRAGLKNWLARRASGAFVQRIGRRLPVVSERQIGD